MGSRRGLQSTICRQPCLQQEDQYNPRARWVKEASEELWPQKVPLEAWGSPAKRVQEALTSGPEFGSTWDALRLVGLLQRDVEALREDIRAAPAICEATRW